jgi:hypothetical protein
MGAQLMEIVVRVFEGLGARGAQVSVRFTDQWKGDILDVEASWAREHQTVPFAIDSSNRRA